MLREIQTAVLDALRVGPLDLATPHMAATGSAALSRLGIYRANLRENFSRALRLTFPVVHRLVGADYFRQTAHSFQTRHPSRCGDLTEVGRAFPDYLGELHRTDRFGYLSDVARLEWLIQESLLAADHAPLDLTLLARVDPSAYESLRFTLHPTLRSFESPFPALAIWEANVEAEQPADIDLARGTDRVALLRRRSRVAFLRLDAGELALLRALGAGESFAAALDCGRCADALFDASASLRRLVAAGAVVDFAIPTVGSRGSGN